MPTWTSTILLLAAGCAAGTARGEWRVWTTTETRHVLREDPAVDGLPVKLAAARNERRSFQVLLRSGAPLAGINLLAGDLTGPDGAVLAAGDAKLYRQHQLEITTATYRNDPFRPGWYPDPLIPFVHPLTGKPLSDARFRAVPFDLPADQTQGFWVDVHVPAAAKAGRYAGTYRVTAAGQPTAEIPVELTVWDFALPDTPTFQTALGSPAERMRGYYRKRAADGKEAEPSDWEVVETQCATLLAEHRVNATPPAGLLAPVAQPDGSFAIPPENVNRLREFIDRYHVNAIQTPHPNSVVKDPEAQGERLRTWLAAFDRMAAALQRPQVVFFTYLKDEPNDEPAYRYVQQWGRAVRQAKSVVRVLVVEQTKTQNESWGDLYGAVDIWCPLFSLHDSPTAVQRQALGETLWCYTALCQGQPTPWWHLDFPLLHYRVPAWMAWRSRIRGILYWGGMSFWQQVDDPWTDPKTLDRRAGRKDPLYNGEGTIVYPARSAGYDGIVSSLRLKALRDAIQDYECLALLERLGRADEAERIVKPLTESFFQWNPDPAAYDRARATLAELILATPAGTGR
jgi:hypothetical protein